MFLSSKSKTKQNFHLQQKLERVDVDCSCCCISEAKGHSFLDMFVFKAQWLPAKAQVPRTCFGLLSFSPQNIVSFFASMQGFFLVCAIHVPILLKTCTEQCPDCGDGIMGVGVRPTHHNANTEYAVFVYQLYLNKAYEMHTVKTDHN